MTCGLSSLARMPDAFAKSFFEACGEFRQFHEECAFFVSKGRFFSIRVDGEERCAQVIGMGNGEGEVGLCIWDDFSRAEESARSNGNGDGGIKGVVVLFWQTSDAPPAEARLAARLGCKIENHVSGNSFPIIVADMGKRALTWRDARWALAALRTAPPFYRRLLSQCTVPPAPYPTVYGFLDTEEQLSAACIGLRGKAETVLCTLRVPPFTLPADQRPFHDRDTARWGMLPHRPLPPPPAVNTVASAVKYYEDQRAAACRGTSAWRLASYGLAIALWKCESEATTNRGIEMWMELLETGDEGRTDREGCRYNLLDMLLEVGRWEAVVKLMERFSDEWSTEWAWSVALVQLRLRGLRSKTAREALCSAVLCNPYVYPLILGDKHIGSSWHGRMASAQTTRAGTFNDEVGAGRYLNAHRCHWMAFGRVVEGGYDAVLEAVRTNGADAYRAWQTKTAEERATRNEQHSRPQSMPSKADFGDWLKTVEEMRVTGSPMMPDGALQANIQVPRAVDTTCAHCGKFGERADFQKCVACLSVVYCGRECQRAHWASHKATCKALRCVGKVVELHSLSVATLNGQRGLAIAWVPDKERLRVRLESDGREVAVKQANLRVVKGAA